MTVWIEAPEEQFALHGYPRIYGALKAGLRGADGTGDKAMCDWLRDHAETWYTLLCEIGVDPDGNYSIADIERMKRALETVNE